MKVTVKGQAYQYNHDDLTLAEGDKLQEQAGIGYLDFANPNLKDFRTWRAIIWLCRMRDGEFSLQYKDVDAKYTDVTFTPDEQPAQDDSPKGEATRTENGSVSSSINNGQPKLSESVAPTG